MNHFLSIAAVLFVCTGCGSGHQLDSGHTDGPAAELITTNATYDVKTFHVMSSGGLPTGDPNCLWGMEQKYDFTTEVGFKIYGCYDFKTSSFKESAQVLPVTLNKNQIGVLQDAFSKIDWKSVDDAEFLTNSGADWPTLDLTIQDTELTYHVKFIEIAEDLPNSLKNLIAILASYDVI